MDIFLPTCEEGNTGTLLEVEIKSFLRMGFVKVAQDELLPLIIHYDSYIFICKEK